MDERLIAAAVKNAVSEFCPKKLTLNISKQIAARVAEKASEMGVAAVVAVADEGANPVLVERMDGAYIASYDIAVGKAYTCASLKMPTTELKKLAQPGGSLYGIQFTNQGKIVIFGGGVPLINGKNTVGGLGVSGGTEEQDTELAEYGGKVFCEIFNI